MRNACSTWNCSGSVRDDLDECCFHVIPGSSARVTESLNLEQILNSQSQFAFPLNWRLMVGVMIAIAHMVYYQTDRIQNTQPRRGIATERRLPNLNTRLRASSANFLAVWLNKALPQTAHFRSWGLCCSNSLLAARSRHTRCGKIPTIQDEI